MGCLRLPQKLDTDLAYFVGVLAGDGSITSRKKVNGTDYEIKCVGNPLDERPFYDDIITPLLKRLFGIDVKPRFFDKGTTYGVRLWSKALVRFFVGIGLPPGRKYEKLSIPPAIKSNRPLLRAFLSGLADTDFCVALKRRKRRFQYYPVIALRLKSRLLVQEVAEAMRKEGFTYSLCLDQAYYDSRFKKEIISHRLYSYGVTNLQLWLETIGFRNPKHLAKAALALERNKK